MNLIEALDAGAVWEIHLHRLIEDRAEKKVNLEQLDSVHFDNLILRLNR